MRILVSCSLCGRVPARWMSVALQEWAGAGLRRCLTCTSIASCLNTTSSPLACPVHISPQLSNTMMPRTELLLPSIFIMGCSCAAAGCHSSSWPPSCPVTSLQPGPSPGCSDSVESAPPALDCMADCRRGSEILEKLEGLLMLEGYRVGGGAWSTAQGMAASAWQAP